MYYFLLAVIIDVKHVISGRVNPTRFRLFFFPIRFRYYFAITWNKKIGASFTIILSLPNYNYTYEYIPISIIALVEFCHSRSPARDKINRNKCFIFRLRVNYQLFLFVIQSNWYAVYIVICGCSLKGSWIIPNDWIKCHL